MSNPKLAVEFAAVGYQETIRQIDSLTAKGNSHLAQWENHTKTAAEKIHESYQRLFDRAIALEDRKTREMFQMSRARLAQEERAARQREQAEASASRAIVAQRKAETAELIAEGKRALAAQEAQAKERARVLASAQRQTQLGMESRVSNAGGYGPQRPSAPTQSPDRMATALNTGMVNAAAFLNVATSAYYMASKAVAVVGSFVLDAAKWEAMTLALENMEGSAENAAGAIARLYEIAKAPGIDLETAQHAYLKLRAVSIQGTEAERIIKAFSNTVARGGGGSVQFGRVLEQFTQMRAENRVLQQDLKFMKNSMPELASLMQKAFGTTTAEGIRKLGLNAKAFTDGILLEMEKLPTAQQTLTSEIENTEVAWSRLKAAMVDTDYVKSKLAALTKTFEALRTAIAGSEKEKAVADINAKYDNQIAGLSNFGNSPARWLASKMPGVSSALNDEATRGQMAGELERQRRADLAALEKGYTKPKSLDEELGQFDPKNPFRVRESEKKDTGKKKYDPIAADQARLRETLRSQAEETSIRDKYNDTVSRLTQEGVDDNEAKAIADRNKTVDEVRRKFNDMRKLAHGNAALLAQINEQSTKQEYETFVTGNDKVLAIREENEKKKLEATRKAQEEEFKAIQDHQKRVDDWNQAQIDKNREKNQAGNALLGEIDPLRAIENEYISHYERINAANFASKEERARVDAAFRLKEEQAVRDFYAAQSSIAVSGASDMFGALAELRKNGTSEANDTYQVLFGISKAFAIADATIKLSSAAISAMAAPDSITTAQKFANMGLVMSAGAGLISQITATAYSGVFDKGGNIPVGKWGIAGENGPEIIQGPAHVTSTRDTARLVGAGGGTKVVVNNYAGASVSTKTNSNGEMEILIQRAAEVAEDRIASGIASGGGKVGRQISNTFGVKR